MNILISKNIEELILSYYDSTNVILEVNYVVTLTAIGFSRNTWYPRLANITTGSCKLLQCLRKFAKSYASDLFTKNDGLKK